jgi:hypothetical protein
VVRRCWWFDRSYCTVKRWCYYGGVTVLYHVFITPSATPRAAMSQFLKKKLSRLHFTSFLHVPILLQSVNQYEHIRL